MTEEALKDLCKKAKVEDTKYKFEKKFLTVREKIQDTQWKLKVEKQKLALLKRILVLLEKIETSDRYKKVYTNKKKGHYALCSKLYNKRIENIYELSEEYYSLVD